MIHECVRLVMEEMSGGRLKVSHYCDFPNKVWEHGFKGATGFGLKSVVNEVSELKGFSPKSGTIHFQWHGSHQGNANGTTLAADKQILFAYGGAYPNNAWVALCLAKMAMEGKSLTEPGYLNVRLMDSDPISGRSWCWKFIASHFGSSTPIPTPKTDPDLFAKVLGEEGGQEEQRIAPVRPLRQQLAIKRLRAAGVNFNAVHDSEAVKATPAITADMEVLKAAGILDYTDLDGDIHYQINAGIDLSESVAKIRPMKISTNPVITEATANGATFSKSGVVVEWVHGAVVVGKTLLGNAGTIEGAGKIAREILNAPSINEAVAARAAKCLNG